MGAPLGNQNGRKAKLWEQAIKRALARKANSNIGEGLDLLADKIVEAAASGEQWAIKEIGDRMDGRSVQQMEVDAELRQRDISSAPLSAGEWAEQYGNSLASTSRPAESVD